MAHQPRGIYLEDFEVGKVYESGGRTITEADIVNFAGVSGDFNPLHMNEEFAKTTLFGKRIAHGALGFVISTGLSNQTGLFEGTTIAFMEMSLKYLAPLCIGDTVHVEMTPQEILPGKKPQRGILKLLVKLVNQEGTVIFESPQVLMMKARN